MLPPLFSCPKTEGLTPQPYHVDLAIDDASRDGMPLPAPAAAPLRAYRSDWSAVPDGQSPSEFVDVRADGHRQAWLYDGGWRVSRHGGRAVLEVPFALTEPYEPLSFRRYAGDAFGGGLPRRYRIQAEARSLGGSMRFRGYGELAIQVFYVDPTHYVEVLQTDEHLLLWEADDAPPMQGKGWTRLGRIDHPAKTGDWVRFGAQVDRRSGEILALLDGRVVLRARSELLKRDTPASFTLRATGNREEWRWVTAEELP